MSGPYKLKHIPKSDTDQHTTITGKVECKHKGGGGDLWISAVETRIMKRKLSWNTAPITGTRWVCHAQNFMEKTFVDSPL